MNIYDQFFQGITPDEWELFAEDFFVSIGFEILDSPAIGADSGKDLKVKYENKKYIVSCKHFISSGHSVRPSDEQNILDRVVHHKVDGFIGFYSTQISAGLQERFNELNNNPNFNFKFVYFDKSQISNIIPRMSFTILQKYGMCNGLTYVLNVPEYEYKPLECLYCKKDILNPLNINKSMVAIYKNQNGELEYVYGCKACLPMNELAWGEISQVLYLEQLQGWNSMVDCFEKDDVVSKTFYKNRSIFGDRILQRTYPQNLGTWI